MTAPQRPPSSSDAALARVDTVLCDLDGVVWLGRGAIPGAVEAIESIRAGGRRVLFVTNNSVTTERQLVDALGSIGVLASGDVVTSAMAAAALLEEGSRVLVAGEAGIVEAVERRGGEAVPNDGASPIAGVDAVLVGLHRDFDYGRLARASSAIRAGARYIATNDDATFPTQSGLDPGGGSIVAAVTTASGVEPVIAGKPHRPMAGCIERMLIGPGSGAGSNPSHLLMVGDRPSTDGRFAEVLGCPFALVRTGVVPPGETPDTGTPVDYDEADLDALARLLEAAPMHRAELDDRDTVG
jgi:glycerol 3-phosphatase-2